MPDNEVVEIDWTDSSEFPEELSPANNNFSVDVLIYNSQTDEHTVGWFDFKIMTWQFLCRESQKAFKWRYFINQIDKFK